MSDVLLRRFSCDAPYCSSKVTVKTGSLSYGTDDSRERSSIRKQGWSFNGLKVLCKRHTQALAQVRKES